MVLETLASGNARSLVAFYIASAFLSGILYLYLNRRWEDVPLKFPLIHFFIVTWSGLMYINFINGSEITEFVWYMDWMVSTPLIVLTLGLTAMHGKTEYDTEIRWDLLGAVMGLQFMVVVTGILSQLSHSYLAFWIGNVFMLGVIYMVWVPFRRIAEEKGDKLGRSYRMLASYISVLFAAYPVIWYLGTPGPLQVLNEFQTSLAFIVLPLMCKQVYGFLDLYLIHNDNQ